MTKKSLGQHWLNHGNVLNSIVDTADIATGDDVLEIGPGQGSLTEVLLARGAKVTAVEFDEELIGQLQKRFNKNDLKIVNRDILQYDFSQMPKGYKIVANIPYYLTSKLIRTLGENKNPPAKAVLLVQKEVAERVNAKPGEMSVLSVAAQAYFETSLGIVVKAELFDPKPKVDSQVLILNRRDKPVYGDMDKKVFFRVVKAGFSERRKKLRSALSGGLQISKEEADNLLLKAGINGDLRAQNLSLSDWVMLARSYISNFL